VFRLLAGVARHEPDPEKSVNKDGVCLCLVVICCGPVLYAGRSTRLFEVTVQGEPEGYAGIPRTIQSELPVRRNFAKYSGGFRAIDVTGQNISEGQDDRGDRCSNAVELPRRGAEGRRKHWLSTGTSPGRVRGCPRNGGTDYDPIPMVEKAERRCERPEQNLSLVFDRCWRERNVSLA